MILDKLASFATDALLHPADKVIIDDQKTRANYKQVNWNDDLILVGSFANVNQGTREVYDPVNEVMEYVTLYSTVATFTFYGDNSEDNTLHFIALAKSQRAIESAKRNAFVYKFPKTGTRIGKVVGSQNQEKFVVEMKVVWAHSTTVETLRIDTTDIQFLVNK